MQYIVGQIMGIIVTILCLIGPLYKKKWMMLVNSAVANLLVALNLLLIGQVGSAIFINLFAIIQVVVSMVHLLKNTPVHIAEKILFMLAFVGLGIFGLVSSPDFVFELNFKNALEILPILGAISFSISTFIKDEQTTRKWVLVNCSVWLIYYGAILSTSVFSQLAGLITTIIALIKYRKK